MRPYAFPLVLGLLALAGCAPKTDPEAVSRLIEQRTGVLLNEPVPAEELTEILAKPMQAEDAVRVSLRHSPRVRAAVAGLGVAEADFAQAWSLRNPTIEAEIRFPQKPFEIALMQMLFDLIQLGPRRRLAEATYQQATFDVANDIVRLAAEARSSFYDLQAAEQALALRKEMLDTVELRVQIAERTHAAGNLTDLELELEHAAFGEAKLELADASLRRAEAREHMNGILGLTGSDTAWTAAALPELPEADEPLADVEEQAIAQRLDLAVARQAVEVARAASPVADVSVVNDLAIGVHVEREPEGDTTTGPALHVPLPLFDTGRPAKNRAAAVLKQAELAYAALSAEVRAQARLARERLGLARARVEFYEGTVLPRRTRVVEQTKLEFNAMLVGVFQLLDARRDEAAARVGAIEAKREYWAARAGLAQVVSGGEDR